MMRRRAGPARPGAPRGSYVDPVPRQLAGRRHRGRTSSPRACRGPSKLTLFVDVGTNGEIVLGNVTSGRVLVLGRSGVRGRRHPARHAGRRRRDRAGAHRRRDARADDPDDRQRQAARHLRQRPDRLRRRAVPAPAPSTAAASSRATRLRPHRVAGERGRSTCSSPPQDSATGTRHRADRDRHREPHARQGGDLRRHQRACREPRPEPRRDRRGHRRRRIRPLPGPGARHRRWACSPSFAPERFVLPGQRLAAWRASSSATSREMLRTARRVAETITYLELSVNAGFMDQYVSALFLPHTDLSLFPRTEELRGRSASARGGGLTWHSRSHWPARAAPARPRPPRSWSARCARWARKSVLAVDADPNACLHEALGVDVERSVGEITEEMLENANGANPDGMSKDVWLELQHPALRRRGARVRPALDGPPRGLGLLLLRQQPRARLHRRPAARATSTWSWTTRPGSSTSRGAPRATSTCC